MVANLDNTPSDSLSQGRMGVCCYLFAQAAKCNTDAHGELAEHLLRNIIVLITKDIATLSRDAVSEIGIGLMQLINRGYVEDVGEDGFLHRIDKHILKHPLKGDEVLQKAPFSDMFMLGIYAAQRMKTTSDAAVFKAFDDFMGEACTELNKFEQLNIAHNTEPYWQSVLHVAQKISGLSQTSYRSQWKSLADKISVNIKIDDIQIVTENEYSWRNILLGNAAIRKTLLDGNIEERIDDTIRNIYYALPTVNSTLSAMGMMLMEDDYNAFN